MSSTVEQKVDMEQESTRCTAGLNSQEEHRDAVPPTHVTMVFPSRALSGRRLARKLQAIKVVTGDEEKRAATPSPTSPPPNGLLHRVARHFHSQYIAFRFLFQVIILLFSCLYVAWQLDVNEVPFLFLLVIVALLHSAAFVYIRMFSQWSRRMFEHSHDNNTSVRLMRLYVFECPEVVFLDIPLCIALYNRTRPQDTAWEYMLVVLVGLSFLPILVGSASIAIHIILTSFSVIPSSPASLSPSQQRNQQRYAPGASPSRRRPAGPETKKDKVRTFLLSLLIIGCFLYWVVIIILAVSPSHDTSKDIEISNWALFAIHEFTAVFCVCYSILHEELAEVRSQHPRPSTHL